MKGSSRVIFYFLRYDLFDHEKRLLAKGLNFSLPPKYLDYADYLVIFELSYKSIRKLGVLSNKDVDSVKTRTKEVTLSSSGNYNNKVLEDLSIKEFLALQNIHKNKKFDYTKI